MSNTLTIDDLYNHTVHLVLEDLDLEDAPAEFFHVVQNYIKTSGHGPIEDLIDYLNNHNHPTVINVMNKFRMKEALR